MIDNIDVVVLWVDGGDPAWQEEKRKYQPEKPMENQTKCFREMGFFRYWFRAMEKYAPWVRKIHFVTWGHLPPWLNTENPKLNIVKHSDFIPGKYLPTFSSNAIELNIHRIKGLAEHFVYFNDDMFLNNPVSEDFFFDKKGMPCDFAYLNNVFFPTNKDLYPHIMINDTWHINRHYSYIHTFFRHFSKFVNFRYAFKNNMRNIFQLGNMNVFSGFEDHHLAAPYLKSTLEESWKESPELFDYVCMNKFRTPYNVSQSVFRYRQLVNGYFRPVSKKSRGKIFRISNDNRDILNALSDSDINMICINDTPESIDFEKSMTEITDAFEKKFPDKSGFEI